MKNDRLYRFLRPILTFLMKVFIRPVIIGTEYIPKEGPVVLAGNHRAFLDSVLILACNKRVVHFLAKKELLEGKLGKGYAEMGIIPVDRKHKDPNSLKYAIEALNNGHIIGIFPEGTFNKSDKPTLPFKVGACKMAYETDTMIIPFTIKGKYRLFSKNLEVQFYKPFKVKDISKDTKKLQKFIARKLEG